MFGQTGAVQCDTEGKTSGNHPEHAPVDFLEFLFSDDTGDAEHCQGNHCNHIGVDSGDLVKHPQKDGHGESHPDDVGLRSPLRIAGDVQFDGLCLEREHPEQKGPGDEQHHDDERHHTEHPLSESYVHVQGVIQIAQCNGVRRGSNRSSNTSEVGCNRNGKSQSDASLAVRRQGFEHRSQEGEHHRRCCSVGHKHREYADDKKEAEKDELRFFPERPQQDACKLHIQTNLCGGNRKDETSQEEHYDRVSESRQKRLVAHQSPHLTRNAGALEECYATVGNGQQHYHNNQNRGGPGRNDLKHPHQGGEHENRNCPLFNHRQPVNSEEP